MRRLIISLVVTAGVVSTVLTAGTVFGGDTVVNDHLVFYKVKNQPTLAEVPDIVLLKDQFREHHDNFEPIGIEKLAVPAEKGDAGYGYTGGPPDHASFHYTEYLMDIDHFLPSIVDTTVTDQFGSLNVRIRRQKPNRLLVPAFKSLSVTPSTPSVTQLFNNKINHYLCYNVALLSTFTPGVQVTVDDQFSDQTVVELRAPRRLCSPAEKIHIYGTTIIVFRARDTGPSDHLMCYRVRLVDDPNPQLNVWTADQFFEGRINAITRRPRDLCVPAEKGELTPVERFDDPPS